MALIRRDSPYPHWEWQHPSTGDQLRLVPERGGLVTGWRCGGAEILYFDAERFADPRQSVRGGIPVLFPICGGLPDNQLPLPQGTFELPQHGFARDQSWQASALDDGQGVQLMLSDTPETRHVFPFAFELCLELRLETQALAIRATVTNRGADVMPFSLGLHPYLAVSGLDAVRFEGLPPQSFDHLTMAPDDTATQLKRLAQGIDLLVRPDSAAPPVRLHDNGNGRTITLENPKPLDLVVIWSDPPRDMVCLEPWSGPRSALISGDHRLELDAGASLVLQCRYRIS
ncbi:MAG: galactose mutarotase [Cyanobacteria bacterium K_DeepCast_35m_m2_023]|nr:galactose mutarotase [Cyanobacteria bacterium K_DeepCast_35m_m2_023]